MKKNILMALVAILAVMLLMTSCSREGNASSHPTSIGPTKTTKNTVSAVLTNEANPTGIPVNWYSRVRDSDATLSGLQQLAVVVNGNEKIELLFGDQYLTSIKMEFTGQSSGKKVCLDNSLVGLATNLGVDSDYFRMEGNIVYFYPHYFNVGEDVVIKTTFTYKKEGVINQLEAGKTVEGYVTFTVGADTGENFSNPITTFSQTIKNFFDGLGNSSGNTNNNSTAGTNNNGNTGTTNNSGNTGITAGGFTWGGNSGNFFEDVEYIVEGSNKQVISKYETDSQSNPVQLKDSVLNLTVYTRESTAHDIVKAYLELPDGTNVTWSNDWFADNCHKFVFDMSAYSGQTVTLRIRLLAGSELWQNEYMYGFITVHVPNA